MENKLIIAKAAIQKLPEASNLSELLWKLNIRVEYDRYTSRDGYSFMGNIAIKKDLEEMYRQFVICHEIGHVIMHSKTNVFSFSNSVDIEKENEANTFACLLLIKLGCENCIPEELKHILVSEK